MNKFNFLDTWTWMASTFGFLALIERFIPAEYTSGLRRKFRIWFQRFLPYMYCDVCEFGNSMSRNSLYQDVETYINSLRMKGAHRLNLSKLKNSSSKEMTFALANNERALDYFEGSEMEWMHHVVDRSRPMYAGSYFTQSDEKKMYTLRINKKDKERVLDSYMKYIETKASELKLAARDLLLYTNLQSRGGFYESKVSPWQSVPFMHPASFDTLALDGDLKSRIVNDLEHFAASEEFYKRVGKAWKRGYLLYGPPGTGKSSMIAAIANKMRYDVYDLELTEVVTNADLRKLLLKTSSKSVIVIEDIDCSLDLSGQRKKKKKKPPSADETTPGAPGQKPKEEQSRVTLSGLLNFVDGLWSCCGSERIFVFTTNFKEKLDPALLRPGRMDMHVNLSYCTFSAFKTLAKTYLDITEHELFEKLESAFEGSFLTPAEVSEEIIKNQMDDVYVALEKLIVTLGEHRVDPATLKNSEDEEEDEDEDEEKKPEEKTAPESKDPKAPKKKLTYKEKRKKDNHSSPTEVEEKEVEETQLVTVTSSATTLKSLEDGNENEEEKAAESKDEKAARKKLGNKQKRKTDSCTFPPKIEEKQPIAVTESAESGKIEVEEENKYEEQIVKKELPSIEYSETQSQKVEDVKEIPAVGTAKQETLVKTQSSDPAAAKLQN